MNSNTNLKKVNFLNAKKVNDKRVSVASSLKLPFVFSPNTLKKIILNILIKKILLNMWFVL